MMDQLAWEKLGDDLLSLDRWGDFGAAKTHFMKNDTTTWKWLEIELHPVNILVNAGVPVEHFDFYVPRLLRALDESKDDAGFLEMVVRALTRKGLTVAMDHLVQLMTEESLIHDQSLIWAIANAIYTIEPRDRLNECLHLCSDRRLGHSRQRLIVHVSRFKKSEEVFQTLLSLLDEEDKQIRGAAFEALKRFGDIRAIPAIERTPVRDGDDFIYERHQKAMALTKLNEKKNRARN